MIAERKNLAALAAKLVETMAADAIAAEPFAPAPLPFPPPEPPAPAPLPHTPPPSQARLAQPPRDAWGLTEAEKAEGAARISEMPQPAADHDAGERAAVAAHYAEPPAEGRPPAVRPDPLRDGLFRGFHAHRPAWDAMPHGAERGLAFAEARQQPGACATCAARRRWCEVGEPDAALRCTTCHPPDHLPPEAVREVTT